ncbi:hypothetical protein [Marinobacterium litorale]|uniref:hypothetical protein n=1 Tax=Marinobacterium litorale TaxID=404770 RepID=UPI0004269A22|nr:hypothetical protein [Marinobacterium litorale]
MDLGTAIGAIATLFVLSLLIVYHGNVFHYRDQNMTTVLLVMAGIPLFFIVIALFGAILG